MKLFLGIILLILLLIVLIPALAIFGLVHGTRSRRSSQTQHNPFEGDPFQEQNFSGEAEDASLSAEEKLINKRFDKSKAEDVEFEEIKE